MAASSDLETNSEYSGDAGEEEEEEEEEEGQGHRMPSLGSYHLGVNGCVGWGSETSGSSCGQWVCKDE